MGDHDNERLIEHEYDGIQEYDNPLPRWWVLTFWATIIFSVLYWFNVPGIGSGRGRIADYEASVAAHAAAHPPETDAVGEEALAALVADPTKVAEGKATFASYCVSCHRADGGGLIGPNLTDDAWIHGDSLVQIHRTIAQGVLAKGMPAWEKLLKPAQVNAVTAYVRSLRGTNPPDPKAPEGVVTPQ